MYQATTGKWYVLITLSNGEKLEGKFNNEPSQEEIDAYIAFRETVLQETVTIEAENGVVV